jgi:L-asparaginase/Glu-tRNA(Gln) amidotransferase subunit D
MLYENKILMLFCGGTISMGNGEEGGLGPVDGDERYQDIFKKVPKINNIADVHVKFIVNEDSSNMGVETWEQIRWLICRLHYLFLCKNYLNLLL